MNDEPRDSQGRIATIHGLVFNGAKPTQSMRELLRQWATSGLDAPGSLLERTEAVLGFVNVDGDVVAGDSDD